MSVTAVGAKGDPAVMIRTWVKPGMTAVDVGAHAGDVCRAFRDAVGPAGTVIAIEPNPQYFAGLSKWADVVYPVACRAHSGDVAWYPDRDTGLQASCYQTLVKGPQDPLTVSGRRLDDLVGHADIVKIDTQGSDVEVLQGAPRLLLTCPAWIIECWPHGLAEAGQSVEQMWDVLHEGGLTVCWADGTPCSRQDLIDWAGQAGGVGFVNLLARHE